MRTTARPAVAARAWVVLAVALASQAAGAAFAATPALLIPTLHLQQGVPLVAAGALAAMPSLGLVATLYLWGAAADRWPERRVIASGLVVVAAAALLATLPVGTGATHLLWLGALFLVGGAASGSASSASGRLVVGWFPRERRGLAMGIRQMAQPLGMTFAALTVPALAAGPGVAASLVLSSALTGALAVASVTLIREPARAAAAARTAAANPYRGDRFLVRIHAASALLVVPQYTLSIFGLVWLVSDLHWNAVAGGVLVGVAQFAGAVGRIGVGVWSDRLGSRMRLLRWVAISAVVVMLLMSVAGVVGAGAGAIVLLIATVVSVADNGLAFTSVAEAAGPVWSGRALGIQNSGQYLAAAAVGPLVGALIGVVGYPLAFVAVAACPAASIALVPHPAHEARRTAEPAPAA